MGGGRRLLRRLGPRPGRAARTDHCQEKEAIEKAIQSYVSAFNAHDAPKLAAHWSPDGVYISRRNETDSPASQITAGMRSARSLPPCLRSRPISGWK